MQIQSKRHNEIESSINALRPHLPSIVCQFIIIYEIHTFR